MCILWAVVVCFANVPAVHTSYVTTVNSSLSLPLLGVSGLLHGFRLFGKMLLRRLVLPEHTVCKVLQDRVLKHFGTKTPLE